MLHDIVAFVFFKVVDSGWLVALMKLEMLCLAVSLFILFLN